MESTTIRRQKSIPAILRRYNPKKNLWKITEEMDECIAFESSFHSPTTPQGGWDVDSEYTEWQWWLARPEGGEWKLLTWGY